ncbi:MAG: DNA-binding protein WhiA [Clostridiales Family XIII bacterium]|nr:DNA-binding protein WhiA [Clostridiales Family XIII bacterium]
MSFSTDVKNEIARSPFGKSCCAASELCGFVRTCGSIVIEGKGNLGVKIATENPVVARRIKTLLLERFGISARLMVGEHEFLRNRRVYELSVSAAKGGGKILRQIGVIPGDKQGIDSISGGLDARFFKKKCCRKALLRGIFLGAGTLSDPQDTYHLEVIFAEEQMMIATKRLLGSFTDMHVKTRQRRGNHIVYVKESEQIKDILTLMGAHSQLLKFEGIRIMKEIRNQTNRANNCDHANMDRTLSASERELSFIRQIQRMDRLDDLAPALLDTALARIDHPDATLSELGALLHPPIGKSAVAARMKRIETFAEELE